MLHALFWIPGEKIKPIMEGVNEENVVDLNHQFCVQFGSDY